MKPESAAESAINRERSGCQSREVQLEGEELAQCNSGGAAVEV